MHPSAFDLGKRFFETYCADRGVTTIVDIGSQNVNGSLKDVCPQGISYIGVDFVAGEGVDVVLDQPYKLPFEETSIDVIVCSSVFEHSQFFWVLYLEMLRILKPNGLLYLNVPSNGYIHRYPVDCWRFYPDAGQALVEWANYSGYKSGLLESFIAGKSNEAVPEGMWNDFVCVFIKEVKFSSNFSKRIINSLDNYSNGYLDNPTLEFKSKNTFLSPDFQDIEQNRNKILSLSQVVGVRDERITSINQVLADCDEQIIGLNQVLGERDEQIIGLNQVLDERDEQIVGLNQVLGERDEQIIDLNQVLAEGDVQIASLNQEIAKRDVQITSLNHTDAEIKRRILEITSSTSWRLTMPLRFLGHQVKRVNHIAIHLPEIFRRGGGIKATIQKASSVYRKDGITGLKRKLYAFSLLNSAEDKNRLWKQQNDRELHSLQYTISIGSEHNVLSRLNLLESCAANRFLSANSKVTWSSRYVPKVSDRLDLDQLPVKVIAFYLPQFHPFLENDAWWGKGFTEWTNVSKAQPQFLGHYQPHLPGELGFYDLRLPEIMHQQVDLARKYGVSAFCFHYYWFGGKRLLELPLNNFLDDRSLNIDFCLCWANENWTRRWDGSENDILMSQNHSPEDDLAFIEALAPAFSDPRYIRVDGKPLLIVYRVSLLPDPAATATRWRKRALEMGFPGLYLVVARSFDITDPRPFGFDAAVEFPPHQVNVSEITEKCQIINPDYRGKIYDYAELAKRYGQQSESKFVNFKTVMPSWDNEARKPSAGHTFAGALPETYAKWLTAAAQTTLLHRPAERLLFVNAWNEWAEGAHLEPDRHYGYAYLHATANVLRNISSVEDAVAVRVAEINLTFIKRFDVAVILHLHYEDLINNIFSKYLSPLQADVDLFVTVKKDVSLYSINEIKNRFSNVYIFINENRGRDIRPFVLAYRQVQRSGYLYACKLHSKKSPHKKDGEDWRENLMTSLVSSRDEVMNIVSKFLSDDKLGLLVPENSLMDLSMSDVHVDNKKWLDLLLARLGESDHIGKYAFYFPAGSMYWFRISALLPLLEESIVSIDEFELEAGQLDGTLAHTVERIIGLVTTHLNYNMREL